MNVAEAFGIPYLPPYLSLGKGKSFRHGVNFAVAGATALDPEFFYHQKLGRILWTNNSLSVQLGWFKKLKPSICTTKKGNNIRLSICSTSPWMSLYMNILFRLTSFYFFTQAVIISSGNRYFWWERSVEMITTTHSLSVEALNKFKL